MLAEQLGLNKEEYTSTFQVASAASERFVEWLPKTMLYLHYSLAVMIEGIQIIDGQQIIYPLFQGLVFLI